MGRGGRRTVGDPAFAVPQELVIGLFGNPSDASILLLELEWAGTVSSVQRLITGIESFRTHLNQPWSANTTSYTMAMGSFPQERDVNHPPHIEKRLKMELDYKATPLLYLYGTL